jgi:hypothetical protein
MAKLMVVFLKQEEDENHFGKAEIINEFKIFMNESDAIAYGEKYCRDHEKPYKVSYSYKMFVLYD